MPPIPALPDPAAPLYNHSLPAIEHWLRQQGCEQTGDRPECWTLTRDGWNADLELDVDCCVVRYQRVGDEPVTRVFKYSLSRADLEAVIFAGP
jgi:hypothetical protein